MADKTTIARPYARAAFAEAQGHKHLGPWSESLQRAAAVVQDPRVQNLLGNPAVTNAQLASFIIELAGPQLDEQGRNFVQTLAENRRLAYLPEISTLFDELKDEAEGVIDVTVTSAAPLQDGEREALSSALQRRLKRQVRLQCQTDPALLGGAVLRAGDLVIDGSVRARLNRIAYELAA
jgi:F-type H+-transporting ATPase subunit delta